jgi:predicted transcriptional regulator of viral defense system
MPLYRADKTSEGPPSGEPLERLRAAGLGAFFRPTDLVAAGLTREQLPALVRPGKVERIGRGLYRLADKEPTEHYTVAAVCALVPKAIVCLLSALSVHEIGTQLPREVWIAIAHKARAPRITEFPIKVIRFSGASLKYGVEQTQLEGVPTRITNPARTVVDCFRFRRLVGSDVAREALREVLRERKARPDEIGRAAEVCRARSVVEPFLEAFAG